MTLNDDFINVIASGGLALLGSIARTLSENLGRKKRGAALAALIISNGVIAGFCGIMAYTLSKALHMDPYWSQFIAGMSGWMGGVFLAIAEKFVTERLGFSGGSVNSDSN
ncbi:MAG: phage holin family protein [Anaerolineales bacterium]